MDKRVERIINIYNRITNGEVISKAAEAAWFGVNERSIQRDLEDIWVYFADNPDLNRELVYDRSKRGYVYDGGSETILIYDPILKSYV